MAVTVNGAKVLKRDDLGVIRPGAIGDFLVYRGDVTKGGFDVAKITHVAKGGVLFVDDGNGWARRRRPSFRSPYRTRCPCLRSPPAPARPRTSRATTL
jgi:adenine deaminase